MPRMSNHAGKFLAAFLRHPARIGAIAPSSPQLARAMVRDLEIPNGSCVIEFGPGTGPFTEALAQCLPADGYLGIEREPNFVRVLQQRFPQLQFIEGSAENAVTLHAQSGLGPVRAIICGLPFASLPPSVQDAVTDALDRLLQPGTIFRTFQYIHAYALPTAVRFRRRMKQIFGPHHRSQAVLRNLPPAYVLTWSR